MDRRRFAPLAAAVAVALGLAVAIEGFFLLRRGVAVMTTTFEERDDALKERGDAEELEPRRESRPAWDGVVPPQRSAVDGASLCRLIGDDPRFAPPTRRVAADGGTRDGARRRMATLARHLLSPWNSTGIAAPAREDNYRVKSSDLAPSTQKQGIPGAAPNWW